jgi:GH15 family glucan-1,4-alpha-glucosidase
MASRIEHYGLIGNTRTAALVSKSGSIDWLCVPRFDSDACFASLLGYDKHGQWSFRPTVTVKKTNQHYDGDTMILVNEITCDGGSARIIDFMPPSHQRSDLVRIVEGISGSVPFESVLMPRFAYGQDMPYVMGGDDGVTFVAGPDALRLRTDAPVTLREASVITELNVSAGQRFTFQLTWYPSHESCPPPLDVDRERERTDAYWTAWANRCTYQGAYREPVLRSLLTLKAMTYGPTGAIVAAPTTSLPEALGSVRNWDYRFCWVRDTTLTLSALLFGGYTDEAAAFRDWVFRAAAGDPDQLQIMYDIHGGRRLTEFELSALPGYEGSRPVRIGNAASEQRQLDIFGELVGAIYLGRKTGMPEDREIWKPFGVLLDYIEQIWQEPDDGVWEVRGGRRHFTYSKVMVWSAIDRAVRLIEEFSVGGEEFKARLPHLRALRERIHDEVCDRAFNAKVGAFTQYYGGEALDASVLLIPHSGFLPANDRRMLSTVAAIERDLMRDGFVLRYASKQETDGLPGDEGAFIACTFWLADNYALAGRVDDAKALFERMLGLRNHLGLLSEEYEPRVGRLISNFPQGFSHLALITTARILESVAEHDRVAFPGAAAELPLR